MAKRRPRLRPTPTGVLAVVFGLSAVAASRLFGVIEFAYAGWILISIPICSLIGLWIATSGVHLDRVVGPRRVPMGDSVTSTATLDQSRRRMVLPAIATDFVDSAIASRQLLVATRGAGALRARYRLETHRRGIATIGPLNIRVDDPFGFASLHVTDGHETRVLVLPQIVPLNSMSRSIINESSGEVVRPRRTPLVSDEFDRLRDYVPGDDVRRVHWPSTARLGRPLVRHYQQPAQRRTAVILDNSAFKYSVPPSSASGQLGLDHASFDRAVTAAASALASCRDSGDIVRLILTSGADSDVVEGHHRFDEVIDSLAVAEVQAETNLDASITLGASDDRIILCSGTLDPGDLVTLDRVSDRSKLTVVDCARLPVDLGRWSQRCDVVRFGGAENLSEQWNLAFP